MANLFGKKQEAVPQEAAVSSIPVPPADSALVIDLPEGQKLVLGKMEEGTVIEVATWRGTGRPDSRTNRLMLGVSFSGAQTPTPAAQETNTIENLAGWRKYVFQFSKLFSFVASGLTEKLRELPKLANRELARVRTRKSSVDKPRAIDHNSGTGERDDFDIDKWLDSVRSNSRVSKLTDRDAAGSRSKRPAKSGAGASSARRKGARPSPTKKSARSGPKNVR